MGFWFDLWDSFTNNLWLHITDHYHTHNTPVFTVTSSLIVASSNGRSPSSGSPYCPRASATAILGQPILNNYSGRLLVVLPLHGSYEKHRCQCSSVVASVTDGGNCIATGSFMDSFLQLLYSFLLNSRFLILGVCHITSFLSLFIAICLQYFYRQRVLPLHRSLCLNLSHEF
jgi:hypothetical protein